MKTPNVISKRKGFTLIEIVLVLAIASLIMLLVFLVLPSVRRSQRDQARKTDAGKITAQLEQYAGNNDGSYPTAADSEAFINNYLATLQLNEPSGKGYFVSLEDGTGSTPTSSCALTSGTKLQKDTVTPSGTNPNTPRTTNSVVITTTEEPRGYVVEVCLEQGVWSKTQQ